MLNKQKLLVAFIIAVVLMVSRAGFAQVAFQIMRSRGTPDAEGFTISFEARKSLRAVTVGSPREVELSPVVANAPCLRLKEGDKLVKGRRWFDTFKGRKEKFSDYDSYFLSSKGEFYQLDSYGSTEQFNLLDPTHSLSFDWNLTLKNAAQIMRTNDRSSQYSPPLSTKQYRALHKAMSKSYPESLRDDGKPIVKKPHLEGEGEERHAVFEMLHFDPQTNTVFHYRFLIGPHIYMVKSKPLLVGPRHPQEWLYGIGYTGTENNEPIFRATPESRAKFQRDEETSLAFRRVAALFLPKMQAQRLLPIDISAYLRKSPKGSIITLPSEPYSVSTQP